MSRSIGAGVKQSAKMIAATTARIIRVRSSGMSSSTVRGWRRPKVASMTIIRTVHTIQLADRNARAIATPIVVTVT